MSDSKLYLIILLAGFTSFAFRFIALFGVRKSSARLKMLQESMPLIIICCLVAFMYRQLDYWHVPFALDYLIAGIIVLAIRYVSKNAVLAIIVSTACFVFMHDYWFKILFKDSL